MAEQRMKQDETYQRYLQQERRKQGKAQPRQTRTVRKQGQAPNEEAARNYMKWRQEQIKQQKAQQADKHQRLLRQQKQQGRRRLRRARR
jgi:hypothetical protein